MLLFLFHVQMWVVQVDSGLRHLEGVQLTSVPGLFLLQVSKELVHVILWQLIHKVASSYCLEPRQVVFQFDRLLLHFLLDCLVFDSSINANELASEHDLLD
jgi:hypothetical protein